MPIARVKWRGRDGDYNEAAPAEFLAAAESDPVFPIPYPFAKSMLSPEYRPGFGVSATSLLKGCLRCKVLEAFSDYTLDIEGALRAWKGTVYHELLETNKRPGDITETRFYAQVPGFSATEGNVVHGKPDIIRPLDIDRGTLREAAVLDLKTTQSVPNYGVWKDHEAQLMLYSWIVRHSHEWDKPLGGIRPGSLLFTHAYIWYLSDSNGQLNFKPIEVTKTIEVATTSKTAKSATKKVRQPHIWSDEEIEGFFIPRFENRLEAFANYEEKGVLPPYPPGFDYLRDWTHRFSPVAELCVNHYIEEQLAKKGLMAA